MQIRDYIELFLLIMSLILAAISVGTVIITVRQNSKMIMNSTRPYVVALAQITNFQNPNFYLVIKNYGNSSATIKSMISRIDLSKAAYLNGRTPFKSINGTMLAPGQSISCCLNTDDFNKKEVESFVIDLEYYDENRFYKESCPINYMGFAENASSRASTKDKELKIISYALQDLVEKQF